VATLIALLIVSAVTVTTAVAGDSALTADFTYTINGNTVSFDDALQPEGNVTIWTWDFGDPLGDQSNQQNPSYTYPGPGTYSVTLTVQDYPDSHYDSITKSIVIEAEQPVLNPPIAQFSANPTTGEIPLKVQFKDDSLRSPTEWKWDFGDGGTSEQQNPEHIYNSAGTFTVTLTVTNADGSDTETSTIVAKNTVNALPEASIGYDKSEGDAPLTVQFQDLSSKGESSAWDFGDGATSTDKDPAHTFADPGTYTVKLTSTNLYGSDDTTCSIKVNDPPVIPDPVESKAFFTKDVSSGDAPLEVRFTDGSTYTSRDNATFSWSFGDGATSDEQNPVHTFTEPGTYTVILTLTDSGYDGDIPTYSEEVTVNAVPIEDLPVDFTATQLTKKSPFTVQFTETYDYDTEDYGRNWYFGDGGESLEQNPSYSYEKPGDYTVELYISGPNGAQGNVSKTITIVEENDPEPQPDPIMPEAAFVMDKSSGIAPLNIQFNDKSQNATSIEWDFGDGSTSDEKDPIHTFAAGNYTVTLTASNDNGTDTQTADVSAFKQEDPEPDPVLPVAGFEPNVTSGYVPLTVKFDDKSSNADEWKWNFGDGESSEEKSPVHIYDSIGKFTANLTVSNDNGTDSREVVISVTEEPTPEPDPITPKAFFTANATSGDAPLAVQFTDKSDFTSLENVTWNWSFDSTSSSTERNPVHTFDKPGTYTVILTIIDKGYEGDIPQYSQDITVTDPAPVEELQVDFSATQITKKSPFQVEFESLIAYESEDVGYTWYIGDEICSFEPNHIYEFAKAGTYDVTLAVNADGRSGEKTKTITIVEESDPEPDEDPVLPVAGFTPNTTSGNAPLTVKFDDESLNAEKWNWDFGDGGSSDVASPIHTYMEAGNYIANLTVSNANGTDSMQVEIRVTDSPVPIANFTCSETSGKAPLTVIFTDSSENAISWKWDFGDKISSTEKDPSHIFSNVGTYEVILTVSNGVVQDSKSVIITVEEPDQPTLSDPIAAFSANVTKGSVPLAVKFTDKSKNAYNLTWDFGDGKTSTEKNPVHIYECKGKFTVKLTARNSNGEDVETMQICAQPGSNGGEIVPVPAVKPVADFKANPICGSAPLCVQFTDLSSKNVKEWKWDFGDGTSSEETNPSHLYESPGTYTVTLKVENNKGESCKYLTIKVLEQDCAVPEVPEKPVCPDDKKVKPDKQDAKEDKNKDFESGYFVPGIINWNPEDGISSILPVSSHKSPKGSQKIIPTENIAAFKYHHIGILSFQFTDCSTGEPIRWFWDFGDGTTSTEKNPTHTYQKAGTYNVKLKVGYPAK